MLNNQQLFKLRIIIIIMEETITISRQEYDKLKTQANIDVDLLTQLMESFKDIKKGRVRKVK